MVFLWVAAGSEVRLIDTVKRARKPPFCPRLQTITSISKEMHEHVSYPHRILSVFGCIDEFSLSKWRKKQQIMAWIRICFRCFIVCFSFIHSYFFFFRSRLYQFRFSRTLKSDALILRNWWLGVHSLIAKRVTLLKRSEKKKRNNK